jgi:hypothetical protein
MMMANMMGAHSVWVRDGVVEDRNIVSPVPMQLYNLY